MKTLQCHIEVFMYIHFCHSVTVSHESFQVMKLKCVNIADEVFPIVAYENDVVG